MGPAQEGKVGDTDMKVLNLYLNGYSQPTWSYRFFRPFRTCGELYDYLRDYYPSCRYYDHGLDTRLEFNSDDEWKQFSEEWIKGK